MFRIGPHGDAWSRVRILITGATGMVGQGVLRECLADPAVEAVAVIGRRSTDIADPKLAELLAPDLAHLSDDIVAQFGGFDA